MEVLKEILRIVTSKADVSKILPELVDQNHSDYHTLTGRYLRGIHTDEFKTDEEAAQVLYKAHRSDQRYRTLKSRVYDRLIHSVLFLQVKQPEHSEYLSYYYKCTRNLICAQTLIRFAARAAGHEVAERTLTMAEKYQFTDICLALAKILHDTSAVMGQRGKASLYRGKTSTYTSLLQAEHRSDFIIDTFVLETDMSSRTTAYLSDMAEAGLMEIRELCAAHKSHTLILNEFRMRITLHSFHGQHSGTLETANEAIAYLEANPHLSQPARLGEFRLQKLTVLIALGKVQEAFRITDYVTNSFRAGGYNWFNALYFSIIAALRVGEYEKAADYVNQATKHQMYNLIDDIRRQNFTLLNAYVLIAEQLQLGSLGNASPEEFQRRGARFKQFRLSTYLNSIPEVSKYKQFYNTAVLISTICFLILYKDFDQAERRIEYIKVYVSRYIRSQTFHRVKIFLRMLQAFNRCSFDPKQIRKANKKLRALLEESGAESNPTAIGEFIKFEVLYEGLLSFLDRYEASLDE